ncbi:SH3 domain-containing protein [Paeniglutamicibacter cryotolerans]|uniref:Uncharacterized protein YraI n=1 Tax=Paeniglutamicibacter cryotolerans TaxID=670079 RepID=A0A839QI64_9MICC|nr:SH3 domain-containing protein [Paeniglutamicibacter cryotolerans]MBB2994434.1 uncharacterized protein YraI [Paeniglutamicibacter cryotolerans]
MTSFRNGGSSPAPTHVTVGELNLRKGSGTEYAVQRILPDASAVTLLARHGSWASVQAGSLFGWVPGHCLRTLAAPHLPGSALKAAGLEADVPSGPPPTHITTAILNLRRGAGTNYTVVRVLVKDSRVAAMERQGTWSRIYAGTASGWVSSAYLSPLPINRPLRGIIALEPEPYRTTVRLNVRKDAGDHYATLQILQRGAKVNVNGSLRGWKRIELERGAGWIPATHLERIGGFELQPKTNADAVLRTGASEKFRVILDIPAGSVLTVRGTRGDWAQVDYDGHAGWIREQFLH